MENFWNSGVWGSINVFAVLLCSLLAGNGLKKNIPLLQATLIPTSVIGGVILIIVTSIYKACTGMVMFDTAFFGGKGTDLLEIITYHSLALGFIAASFKTSDSKMTKERSAEILNTGLTTVSCYLIQAILGLAITMISALIVKGFFPAAGTLLAFGYGQGTGQAMNYGNIYEADWGFAGGKSFGLTIAAIGFICAAIGGVIHMNYYRKKGIIKEIQKNNERYSIENIEKLNEIPMQESLDKMTIQVALVCGAYLLTYIIMYVLGNLAPGLKSIVFGFNFLLGVMCATLIKFVMNKLRVKRIMRKNYVNDFLMTRISSFFYDLMIVSGVAAIRFSALENYWGIIVVMCLIGAVATYVYNRFVAKRLFPDYEQEQFLVMYGMLTGTASTGVILLREIDPEFKTPASDNLVYQNFPAIIMGFPMMIIATAAPKAPLLVLLACIVYCAGLNLVLFRKQIFKKK